MTDRQKNLLALGLGLALAGLAGEVSLRVYQRAVKGIPLLTRLPGYQPELRFPLSPFLVFGPFMNLQIPLTKHPETSYFNAQGFRTRETLGPKPPGEVRVIALGESTTEDFSNSEGIHWPLVLERELHRLGRGDVRVYNAAKSGYSSAHTLVRFEFDILQYQPDIILVMDNDWNVNYFAAAARTTVDPSYRVKYRQKHYSGILEERDVVESRLFHSIFERLREVVSKPTRCDLGPYDLDAGIRIFKRNLANVIAVARANGVRVVLLTMPAAASPSLLEEMRRKGDEETRCYPDFDRLIADFDQYNGAIREVAREQSTSLLDMRQLLPRQDSLFSDVVHHTSAGVRAFGETAAKGLLPILPARTADGGRP